MYQIITLNTLSLHHVVCQFYLNKAGGRGERGKMAQQDESVTSAARAKSPGFHEVGELPMLAESM